MADCYEGTFKWSDFKLILTPLSQISDKDAIEVDKIISGKQYADIKGFCNSTRGKIWVNDIFCNNEQTRKSYLVCQFLQSKGYDLPHYLLGNKTLHECGLAIYESDNTENP